uniref:Uncharacterized protein n=1 Tax=Parascaris univalens TaxID=6257 RepID=A0A914ZF36_PARUN
GGVSGVADGEMNSLTGSSNLTMSGLGTIGQSIMSAESGGKGPSSALTSAKLNITGTDDVSKDITVQGSVSASGDKTYVHSVSSIVEKNGVQTITNFQNSSSQSQAGAPSRAIFFADMERTPLSERCDSIVSSFVFSGREYFRTK